MKNKPGITEIFDLVQCACGAWCDAEPGDTLCIPCRQAAEILPYQEAAFQMREEEGATCFDVESELGGTNVRGSLVDIFT